MLTFTEIRSFLRTSRALPAATFFGVLYALASLLGGGMLSLYPLGGGTTVEILTGSGTGQGWWNYPGLLVVAPWGVLALPMFATFAMVVVAVGVGLGMAVAAVLIYRLVRPSPQELARTKAVGALTGLTPAMISLVTLGSCCTTTAAATGGIGLIAQASGTTTANLLANSWYLGLAQMIIVWVALVGQELLLTVYGGLLGLRGPVGAPSPLSAPRIDRRWAAGAALRSVLAIGAVLWSLSMFAEWTTHDPMTASAGWWFRWVVQHQLIAAVAAGAAFVPLGALRFVRFARKGAGRIVGAVLVLASVSLLFWLPAPLPSWGLDSLGSQMLGTLGASTAWGAIPLGSVTGAALYLRWALEYLAPAGFVLFAVLAPDRAFAPLIATVAGPATPAWRETDAAAQDVPAATGGGIASAPPGSLTEAAMASEGSRDPA